MKLVMTLLVRDEDDILEDNLRYHFARGVDFVIATDNGSSDRTPEILSRYEDAGLLQMVEEPPPEEWFPRHQGRWVTRMARMAATEFDADWVINNDADEFWWPVMGSLKDVFAEVPERYGALVAPRSEFVPRPDGPGSPIDRLLVREAVSRTSTKIAHRGSADVLVHSGSHVIESESGADILHRPRKLMRPLVSGDDAAPDTTFVPVPHWPVRILHLPIRSFAQYERLAKHAASGATGGRRRALREAQDAGGLTALYERLVRDDAAIDRGLRSGQLVRDDRLRDYLARCPDPATSGPAIIDSEAVSGQNGSKDVEEELADIEFETSLATVLTERSMSERTARLTTRLDRLVNRLKEARELQPTVKRGRRRPPWRRAR